MSDVIDAAAAPPPSLWRELGPTVGAVLTLVAGGVVVANLLVGPVQARVDRLETQQHEARGQYEQILQRTTRTETKVDQVLQFLRTHRR